MREHAQLVFTLGIKRIIVAITKRDTCGWSERRYNEIVDETRRIIMRAGYSGERTPYMPVSGLVGSKISTAIESSWYNDWPSTSRGITEYPGKSLLDSMNYVQIPGKKTSGSFQLPIRNVYYIPGAGREDMYECTAGDIVGLSLGDTDNDDDAFNIRRGEVVSDSDDPASNCSYFTVQITNHPGWIKSGYTTSVHCGTGRAPCRLGILHVLDRRTGRVEGGKKKVRRGDAAMVRMTPYKPFSVEAFKSYPALGRVVVQDLERTAAVGIAVC